MQHGAGVVAHVHGGVDGQQEKANPQLVATAQQLRVGAHDQGKRFTVAELVVAPQLEPAKDGVKAFFGVLFELAEDGDVARVADLLGQVSRVVNVFGLEEGVLLGALQVAQIDAQVEVAQRQVDEARVARFVARQVGHQLFDVGVADVLADLVVEHAARKLRREGADQKVHELLAHLGREAGHAGGYFARKGFVALEVVVVVVALVLGHHLVPLGAHRLDVDAVHGIEVGGVKTRADHVAVHRLFVGVFSGFDGVDSGGVHGVLRCGFNRV